MDKRTTGIIATIASVFLCACPGFFGCLFAALIAFGAPITVTDSFGGVSTNTYPIWVAIGLLLISLLLVLVPVVVGIVTYRTKPAARAVVVDSSFNEPIPPPS